MYLSGLEDYKPRLTDQQAKALALYAQLGTKADVARAMGISPKRVEQLLKRAAEIGWGS